MPNVTQGIIPVAVPFSYYPRNAPIAYVVGLYNNAACTQSVRLSARSPNVLSLGLTNPKQRCNTTIDLAGVSAGSYYQGYTAYVNNVPRSVVPLPDSEKVTVQSSMGVLAFLFYSLYSSIKVVFTGPSYPSGFTVTPPYPYISETPFIYVGPVIAGTYTWVATAPGYATKSGSYNVLPFGQDIGIGLSIKLIPLFGSVDIHVDYLPISTGPGTLYADSWFGMIVFRLLYPEGTVLDLPSTPEWDDYRAFPYQNLILPYEIPEGSGGWQNGYGYVQMLPDNPSTMTFPGDNSYAAQTLNGTSLLPAGRYVWEIYYHSVRVQRGAVTISPNQRTLLTVSI
jgi:hypothetical protein